MAPAHIGDGGFVLYSLDMRSTAVRSLAVENGTSLRSRTSGTASNSDVFGAVTCHRGENVFVSRKNRSRRRGF